MGINFRRISRLDRILIIGIAILAIFLVIGRFYSLAALLVAFVGLIALYSFIDKNVDRWLIRFLLNSGLAYVVLVVIYIYGTSPSGSLWMIIKEIWLILMLEVPIALFLGLLLTLRRWFYEKYADFINRLFPGSNK